jgi:photosystem II stability/assembly factor-like uncharacterized protein
MKNIIYSFIFILIVNCTLNIDNCMGQWVQLSDGIGASNSIYSLVSSGTKIFTGTSDHFGVYFSTDNGNLWIQSNNNINQNPAIHTFILNGTDLYAGSFYYGIYKSTDNGIIWNPVNYGLTNLCVLSFTVNGNYLFAGTRYGGVFRSTDNGDSWTAVNSGLTNLQIYALISVDNNIFAGTFGNGVFRSTNNGNNWTAANGGIIDPYITTFISNGSKILAGSGNKIYRSSNYGGNWTATTSYGFTYVTSLVSKRNHIFSGNDVTTGSGVYKTTNNGDTWKDISQGLGTGSVQSLLIAGNYIYAGTDFHSIWRRDLNEIITEVQETQSTLPDKFSLSQNYPNPFNPATTIRYTIPENGKQKMEIGLVVLKVNDILGKEVETLVNEKKSPGTYEVTFDGSRLSSGIYFYTLAAGDFKETKKSVLLK